MLRVIFLWVKRSLGYKLDKKEINARYSRGGYMVGKKPVHLSRWIRVPCQVAMEQGIRRVAITSRSEIRFKRMNGHVSITRI